MKNIMWREWLLVIVATVVLGFTVTVIFDDPSGYTTHYSLRMWNQGDNPSSDSLNANWIDTDSLLNALIVYTDTSQMIIRDDTLVFADGFVGSIIDSVQYDTVNSTIINTIYLNADSVDAAWIDSVRTSQIWFQNNIANPPHQDGLMFHDSTKHSLSYYVEEEDVTMDIGRELWLRVYNNSGVSIPNGSAVYPTGAVPPGFGTVALAQADSDATSNVIGIATHSIENDTYGYITRFGDVGDVNTIGLAAGATFYLSADTAGRPTTTKPAAPNNAIPLGGVTSVGATGSLFALVERFDAINGIASVSFADSSHEIDATNAVQVTNPNGDLFTYNTSVGHDITLSGDTIYVADTGVYNVAMSVAFEGGAQGIYQFTFKDGDTVIPNYSIRRKTSTSDVGAAAMVLSVALEAGDYITLWVEDIGTSVNVTFNDCAINVTQVR